MKSRGESLEPATHDTLELARIVESIRVGKGAAPSTEERNEFGTGPRQSLRFHGRERRSDRLQRHRRCLGVDLEVRLISGLDALLDADEVQAVPTKCLDLTRGPPKLPAAEGFDQVRHVVPEPRQDPAEFDGKILRRRSPHREVEVRQEAGSVKQRKDRTDLHLLETALSNEEHLDVCSVREDDEDFGSFVAPILEEQRRAKLCDDRGSVCEDIIRRLIGRHDAEVDVGILIRVPPSDRAPDERGHNSVVGLTGVRKAGDQLFVSP